LRRSERTRGERAGKRAVGATVRCARRVATRRRGRRRRVRVRPGRAARAV